MHIDWPEGLSESAFMEDFWQKKPLLLRQAFKNLPDIISPDELAGMALEPEIESRVIAHSGSQSGWQLFRGPFDEAFFASLPESHWTLLVQDVDKYIPAARQLVNQFNFIPGWRMDDLMVSYAEDQGSVGPHTDSYDVFLIQLQGNRLWQISEKIYTDNDLLPDSEVRVLKHFGKQQEWLLRPGDMLYLPPKVAHWGIAQGQCLTASVGFLAPLISELFSAWSDNVLQQVNLESRYSDPEFSEQQAADRKSPAEISASESAHLDQIIQRLIDGNTASNNRWFGELISQSKPHLEIIAPETAFNGEDHLHGGTCFSHHPYLRLFYSTRPGQPVLVFGNGESFTLDNEAVEFARFICEHRTFYFDDINNWLINDKNRDCLVTLINLGCIELHPVHDEYD